MYWKSGGGFRGSCILKNSLGTNRHIAENLESNGPLV